MIETPSGLVVCLPDTHVIAQDVGYDARLHEKVCEALRILDPSGIVHLGDLIDCTQLSSHRKIPQYQQYTMLDSRDATKLVLADWARSSPNSLYRKIIPGNHPQRFEDRILERMPELFGVTTVAEMLGCDGTVWEWLPGGYPGANCLITPKLLAMHGNVVRSTSGASVRAEMVRCAYSLIIGHVHRMAIVLATQYEADGTPRVTCGIEGGCLADPTDGLGYCVHPDWQQGFVYFDIYQNGGFKAHLVHYLNGQLYLDEGRI